MIIQSYARKDLHTNDIAFTMEKNEEKDDNDEEDDELIALWGKNSMQDSLFNDALYNFRNPTITSPAFIEIAARKQFLRSDIAIAWREVWHLGGEGQEADTLTFDYEVQLFNGKSTADKKATLETEPIYTNLVKGSGDLIDTIHWEKIKDKVEEIKIEKPKKIKEKIIKIESKYSVETNFLMKFENSEKIGFKNNYEDPDLQVLLNLRNKSQKDIIELKNKLLKYENKLSNVSRTTPSIEFSIGITAANSSELEIYSSTVLYLLSILL